MQKSLYIDLFLKDLENKKLFFDSKTILQEIVQANFKEVISYHLIGEEGPDHNKIFRVAVHIGERRIRSRRRPDEESSRAGGCIYQHFETA